MDTDGVRKGMEMITPSCELIPTWGGEAYWMLSRESCQNVLKKKDLEWKT